MSEHVRVGIIGTGYGATHVERFGSLPGVEVTGICSSQRARAEEVASRLGVPFATDDYRELLDRSDAIVIVTPPALHASMALDAIAAGKHVLCEKPMSATLDEARAMRDSAQSASVICMVNFQMRFAPPYAEAHRLMDDGYLGRLVMADARVTINPVEYLHLPLWSTSKAGWFTDASQGGGLLGSSAGPHIVDLMRWFGGPVTEVASSTIVSQPSVTLPNGAVANVEAEDGFLVLVRYASGAIGTIRGVPVTHRDPNSGWSMELTGDGGSLQIAGDDLRGARSGDDALSTIAVPDDASDNRLALVTRFVDAIRTGDTTVSPSFDDGLASQAVLDACLRAARSNAWVAVEE